jgi:hypothetical protein
MNFIRAIKISTPKADIKTAIYIQLQASIQSIIQIFTIQNDTVTQTNRQYEEASPACLERVRAVRAVRHAKK